MGKNDNKSFKIIRGGSTLLQSTLPILSTITTIVKQSLNVAMAAFVASGYVGCYIASFVIRHLQLYCDTTVVDDGSDFSVQTYKWTILATLTHIILNLSSNSNILSNPTFLPTLWAYSTHVNPTIGGFIGFTHLLLGGVSSILGSRSVVDRLGDLMKVRLPPLDKDGNMSYDIDTFQHYDSEKGLKNGGVRIMRQVLVRIVSSCSIFTSFPRDMLSMYMGTSALLTYILSLDLDYEGIMWKVVRDQIPWWRGGLLGGADVVVDTSEVTMRLFVMHWIVMLVKGTTSVLLLQR